MKSIWEFVFWTITNCDSHKLRQFRNPCRRNLWFVPIFFIKAVTAQTESNNTENMFWVLGKLPRLTFYRNMKNCIFIHFGVISLVYLFVCMYISYKAHNQCTQETFLKGSDFDVIMFSALRSIPSVTMKSIWEVVFWTITNCDSHKFRQFRNPCHRNLWFVPIFLAITAQTESNNTEYMFWVLGRVPRFTFYRNMKSCIFTQFWCYSTGISVCMYVYQL